LIWSESSFTFDLGCSLVVLEESGVEHSTNTTSSGVDFSLIFSSSGGESLLNFFQLISISRFKVRRKIFILGFSQVTKMWL
jgi:hypothetical protein